jgi:hypothetical protein
MERHAVPQNIMEVEFKLFGSLTVRQFGYLALAFIIDLVLYFSPLQDLYKYPLMFIFGFGGIFFALGQINGQPVSIWFGNFITAIFSSQERVWKKTSVTPEILKETPNAQIIKPKEVLARQNLNPILLMQDTPLLSFTNEAATEYDQKVDNELKSIDSHFNFLFNDLPNTYKANIDVSKSGVSDQKQTNFNPNAQPVKKVAETIVAPDPNKLNLAGTAQYNSPINKKFDLKDYTQKVETDVLKEEPVVDEVQKTSTPIDEIAPNHINIISGLVVNKKGEPIVFAQIYIKNANNDLMRIGSTDNDGKFSLSTALNNGEYFVEIDVKGCKFPRFKVILNGTELPLYKFNEQ